MRSRRAQTRLPFVLSGRLQPAMMLVGPHRKNNFVDVGMLTPRMFSKSGSPCLEKRWSRRGLDSVDVTRKVLGTGGCWAPQIRPELFCTQILVMVPGSDAPSTDGPKVRRPASSMAVSSNDAFPLPPSLCLLTRITRDGDAEVKTQVDRGVLFPEGAVSANALMEAAAEACRGPVWRVSLRS